MSPPLRMRTGRRLGRTLYILDPGDDRDADKCIGIVDTPAQAAVIVAAVNAAEEREVITMAACTVCGGKGEVVEGHPCPWCNGSGSEPRRRQPQPQAGTEPGSCSL